MKKTAIIFSSISFLGLLIPIAGLVLGIVGIVLSRNADQEHQRTALILGIIGVVVSIANWIIGTIMLMDTLV
jgi:MFS-type transporter involved in bile tolerance (Atg22 family)